MDLKKQLSASTLAEALAAVALILWRLWELKMQGVWRDWVTILALYWLFLIFGQGKKPWLPITIAVLVGLILLYEGGQYPFLLRALGINA